MGKQWARQEIKKNEIAGIINLAIAWIAANREKSLGIGGGILGIALLGGIYTHNIFTIRNTAWEKLAIAQSYSYQGKPDQALDQIKSIELEYGHTPASGFGTLFAGDILYRQGRYKEADQAYQKILEQQYPKNLIPFALSDLGLSQEAAGDCKNGVETDQRFLDSYQDHFLAPQVHASLARCLEAMGQKDRAKAIYERISLLYPDTYWAKWAQDKLKS